MAVDVLNRFRRRTKSSGSAEPNPWRRRKRLETIVFAPLLAASLALLVVSGLIASNAGLRGDFGADARQLGVNGKLSSHERLDPKLLEDADDPDALAESEPIDAPPNGRLDIPEPVLHAYMSAADTLAEHRPECGLHWSVLAGIGRIESGHARSGDIDVDGKTARAILGPRLDGSDGVAAIPDTDSGELDGDRKWDRAVGPMQFIPSTWRKVAADGTGNGETDPHNVHDATLAAGKYLCAGGQDLRGSPSLARAVFSYNQSAEYVREVLIWANAYRRGVEPTPTELAPPTSGNELLAGQRPSPDHSASGDSTGLTLPTEPLAPPPEDTPAGGGVAERPGVGGGGPSGGDSGSEAGEQGQPPVADPPPPDGEPQEDSIWPLPPAESAPGGGEHEATRPPAEHPPAEADSGTPDPVSDAVDSAEAVPEPSDVSGVHPAVSQPPIPGSASPGSSGVESLCPPDMADFERPEESGSPAELELARRLADSATSSLAACDSADQYPGVFRSIAATAATGSALPGPADRAAPGTPAQVETGPTARDSGPPGSGRTDPATTGFLRGSGD